MTGGGKCKGGRPELRDSEHEALGIGGFRALLLKGLERRLTCWVLRVGFGGFRALSQVLGSPKP